MAQKACQWFHKNLVGEFWSSVRSARVDAFHVYGRVWFEGDPKLERCFQFRV